MIDATGRKIEVEKLNVLVFGAGAIGTYIGGSLALAGHHLVFLEQPGVAEKLHGRGLRLELKNDKDSPVTIPSSSFTITESLSEASPPGSI